MCSKYVQKQKMENSEMIKISKYFNILCQHTLLIAKFNIFILKLFNLKINSLSILKLIIEWLKIEKQ
jgi:hypothetical protein